MGHRDAPGPDRPLLAGKLMPPWTRPTAVRRPRLLARLDVQVPLTVVAAPAGWGKTTLLAQWAAARGAAWVTLDEGDDDPARFWSYVVAALQRHEPHVGQRALAALRVPGVAVLDAAVPSLINDLAGAGADAGAGGGAGAGTDAGGGARASAGAGTGVQRALVLDDYHLIADRGIHEAVEFLLTYLPPGVRMVIAGRADPPLPLARLRARGQLAEIRQADLAFAADEAGGLVRDVAAVALDGAQVDGLVDRTEGWAAGLHLAALTLRGADEPGARIREIRGDDRHVVDYLGAEVLAHLPDERRHFLVRSSVLERLSGPLCDVALERTGSADLLAALERAGLFLVALDERREWYRFHRLFRDALRRELVRTRPDDVPGIHERAAAWWRAHGDVESAVRHLIAAGRQPAAAELLAVSDDAFLGEGAAATYLQLAAALDEALVARMPRLAIAMAAAAAFGGHAERVGALLDVAEAGLAHEDEPPQGWSSARAAIATLRATFGRPADLAGVEVEARAAVELEADPRRDGYVAARLALGVVLAGLGRHAEAVPLLDEAWRRAGALDVPVFTRLVCAGALALSLRATGRGAGAQEVVAVRASAADRLEAALGDAAGGAVAMLRAAQGRLAYDAGRPADARTVLERAAQLARAAAHPSQTAGVLVTLADALLATGDRAAARAALAEARDIADDATVFPATLRRIAAAEQRIGHGAVRDARRAGALVEALTERELSVLRALQGTLSQREIGRELFLSVNTVKGYTRSLYRKLGVASRSDAVARGRDLGLI